MNEQKEALELRLREAKAKTSKLQEEMLEKEEIRELERKIRFEENKARDLPHIQKAEDEHGAIRVVNTEDGAVVLRRPHHLVFNKFVRRMGDDKKPLDNDDYWRLAKPCIIYPDVATVEAWAEKFALLPVELGNKVVELGKAGIEEVEGK